MAKSIPTYNEALIFSKMPIDKWVTASEISIQIHLDLGATEFALFCMAKRTNTSRLAIYCTLCLDDI
jgi:hypothetical protein